LKIAGHFTINKYYCGRQNQENTLIMQIMVQTGEE